MRGRFFDACTGVSLSLDPLRRLSNNKVSGLSQLTYVWRLSPTQGIA